METTWNRYYGVVRRLSAFTGAWPHLEPRTRLLRTGLLSATLLTISVPQMAYHATCKKNLQCVFESMTSYLLSVVIFIKIYTFQFNTRQLRYFTERLFADWSGLEAPEEYEIMKSYAANSRLFSLTYPLYCFVSVLVFMSMSLIPPVLDVVSPLNESRPILLPYPSYYFVDSREYFAYIFCHSILAWELIITGIAAHDCMFVTYVEHVCSVFSVIGFRFECLFRSHNDAMKNANVNLDDICRKRIAFFVHKHRKALRFAQLLENFFTIPFAIQLLITTIGLSITLLQVTKDTNAFEIIRYILYIFGQVCHLFFLSFEGQKLMDHSAQMRDRIYTSTWYEAPVKSRKLLTLVMMRSLRPSCLSAGKIYVFSLESFTTVVQTSMSYFTVLASFQ